MRKDDSVFFFTLVDFLVTTLFFGLVLYAMAGEASAASLTKQNNADILAKRLSNATGVSDLTELTDRLTRLGPVKDIEQTKAYVDSTGGLRNLQAIQELVRAVGGLDSLSSALVKLRRQEGFGTPPCRYTLAPDGKKVPTRIATVRATDSTITLTRRTAAFDSLLTQLGLSVSTGTTFHLGEFRRNFSRLPELEPNCRFWIDFIEDTKYVDARDSAAAVFRLNRVRR